MNIPTLTSGPVQLRPVRGRDWRDLQILLRDNRAWLVHWEATNPDRTMVPVGLRAGIRQLLANARLGVGLPFVIEYDGEMVGQLNVSGITYGALSTATIGYWIAKTYAGRGIMPVAVALATDHCLLVEHIHRMEICIRPENAASLRVVEKLGFADEGIRRRYIHIDGAWRDHRVFSVLADEIGDGLISRVPPAGMARSGGIDSGGIGQ